MFLKTINRLKVSIMITNTKAQVFYTSNPEVAQLGACATMKNTLNGQVVENADLERFNAVPNDAAIILVAAHLAAKLSIPQMGAIIAHEQGHIDCGHLIKGAEMVNAAGLIDSLTFELEADAGAVALFGKETVRVALTLTVEAVVDYLISSDVVPEDDRDNVMEFCNTSMEQRYAALAA